MTAVDRSYREIKIAILNGSYPRGIHLKEEELAERIGVSRTPIREALRRLDADGLVQFVPHQGAFVSVWGERDLDEIFRLRVLLEGYAVELAARNIGPVQLAELERLAEQMEETLRQAPSHARMLIGELNGHFHRSIIEAAESRRIETILGGILELPLAFKTFQRFSRSQLERGMGHHRELIAALAAADPIWAGSIMRAHLQAGRDTYMKVAVQGSESGSHVDRATSLD